MVTDALRLLRNFLGFLLAAVALLVTVFVVCLVCAVMVGWWQDGRLSEGDVQILSGGGGVAVAGVLLTWAGFWLARDKPRPGEVRVPSFTLVRSPGGRQERFVEVFTLVIYFIFFGGWLWSRAPGEPWARGAQVTGWLAVVYLGLHVRVLLHELGHLGAAWWLGMEPVALRVGVGPTLWRGRTQGGMDWEWRLRPNGGWAQALHPDGGSFRLRQAFFVAGGPLADTLQLTLLWWVLPHPRAGGLPRVLADSAGLSVANVLLFALAVSAAVSLVPHRPYVDNRLAYSDGWWLCRLPFLPAARIEEWVFADTWARLVRLWERGEKEATRAKLTETLICHPERAPALALFEGRLHRLEGDPATAAACFQRALEGGGELPVALRPHVLAERAAALAAASDPEKARAECAAALAQVAPLDRVALLDAFACLPILHQGAGALLPDAERWCTEALALAPEQITLRGTLGSLFIEQGRVEEGEAILREVLARTTSDLDRGIAAFYLALVAHRRGLWREMRAFRRQALRLCRVPVLLGRVQSELPSR